MRRITNTRGFTLVELLIGLALTSMVLSGVYYLLSFSMRSYSYTDAKFIAEQEARRVIMTLEEDIRTARSVAISGTSHRAVELSDGGMKATIYTDIDNDGVVDIVQYKLENNQLKRGEAAIDSTPANWVTVAERVYNKLQSPAVPIFKIVGKQININLLLSDAGDRLKEDPVSVSTSISVRSKGAMD